MTSNDDQIVYNVPLEHTRRAPSSTSSTESPQRTGITLPSTPYDVNLRTRERTPDLAVQTFDGDFEVVRANRVETRRCNRNMFNFLMSALIVSFVCVVCLVYLVVVGFDSPGASWLQTIVAFCVGVFLPQPSVKKRDRGFYDNA